MSKISLYRTTGNRAEKHCCVLYFRSDKDWGNIQRVRNGNGGMPLWVAEMTPEAEAWCKESKRARSLQYSGVKPADSGGMGADLESLGFSEAAIEDCLKAAEPCWPKGVPQ